MTRINGMGVPKGCRVWHFPRIRPDVEGINPALKKGHLKWLGEIAEECSERARETGSISAVLVSGRRLPVDETKILITSNFHPNEVTAIILAEKVAVGLQEKGYEVVLCKLPYRTSRLGLAMRGWPGKQRFPKGRWYWDEYQDKKLASVVAEFPGFQLFNFHNTPVFSLRKSIRFYLRVLDPRFPYYAYLLNDLGSNIKIKDGCIEIGAVYGPYPQHTANRFAKLLRRLYGEISKELIFGESYFFGRADIKASKKRGLMSARVVGSIVERMHAFMTIRSAVAEISDQPIRK